MESKVTSPKNMPEFEDFRKQFSQKFQSSGIFSVQRYNAMKLLEKSSSEYFDHQRQIPASTVEIVNVMAKGRGITVFTGPKDQGFRRQFNGHINGATSNYTNSMDNIGEALWPMQPWYAS
ncbi:hypothetical protein OSB04_031252 [Centaurea solstitialis]|uniref:Uncharacterized protein n=1 Tax=Centaurea solstitialis TaxID=347529 RepID=A0AA38W5T5_9ASTR|nr:hypothetical protein OSB04_031252 [Centaurea solstitialis]